MSYLVPYHVLYLVLSLGWGTLYTAYPTGRRDRLKYLSIPIHMGSPLLVATPVQLAVVVTIHLLVDYWEV